MSRMQRGVAEFNRRKNEGTHLVLRPVVWSTETPVVSMPIQYDDTKTTYVVCRTCRYEKIMGQPCGEPCV